MENNNPRLVIECDANGISVDSKNASIKDIVMMLFALANRDFDMTAALMAAAKIRMFSLEGEQKNETYRKADIIIEVLQMQANETD